MLVDTWLSRKELFLTEENDTSENAFFQNGSVILHCFLPFAAGPLKQNGLRILFSRFSELAVGRPALFEDQGAHFGTGRCSVALSMFVSVESAMECQVTCS